MLTFLNPAALLALTGLLVPVAIHLWNRRPGREVAVGSLRWLTSGANRRLRNLKLEQLWLLLLRAVLLAMLAVAVAGPAWRTTQPASRGVVLLSPEAAELPALAAIRPTIDSLRRKGYALRWLSTGFPRVPRARWQATSRAADSAKADPVNAFAWARVQQAAAVFPGQPLVVVTSARLRHMQGSHAPLPAQVRWQVLPDTASTSWLAAAQLAGDSLQLLVGRSSETGTAFRQQKVLEQHNGQPIRVPGLAPIHFLSRKGGGDSLVLAQAGAQAPNYEVGVTTSPPVIEIYASPEFAADARYVEAALRAAAVGMPIRPVLHRVQVRPERLVDWTFWFSNEPLPKSWQEDMAQLGHHLWQEAAGPGVADTARLAVATTSAPAVSIFRRGTAQPAPGSAALWADGHGRPVLSWQAVGRGARYQLHTRLHPAWSQLADDPDFPAQLLALLQPEATDEAAATLFRPPNPALEQRLGRFDQRALDPGQLSVLNQSLTAAPGTTINQRTSDLRPWLVLGAGLLFLLERLLARRQQMCALSSLAS